MGHSYSALSKKKVDGFEVFKGSDFQFLQLSFDLNQSTIRRTFSYVALTKTQLPKQIRMPNLKVKISENWSMSTQLHSLNAYKIRA